MSLVWWTAFVLWNLNDINWYRQRTLVRGSRALRYKIRLFIPEIQMISYLVRDYFLLKHTLFAVISTWSQRTLPPWYMIGCNCLSFVLLLIVHTGSEQYMYLYKHVLVKSANRPPFGFNIHKQFFKFPIQKKKLKK